MKTKNSAISVYGLFGYALTHLTGLTTGTAVKAMIWDFFMMSTFIGDLVSYGMGGFVMALIIGPNKFTIGRQYGAGFIIQALALTIVASDILYYDKYWAQFLICFACGVQNAMTSAYTNNILRTTHATGLLNDTFLITGHYIRSRDPKDMWRVGIFGSLYLSFFVGSILGTVAWINIQGHSIWVPAAYAFFWGILIFILKGVREPVQYGNYDQF